jgi:chromosome segregation ATPase/DNA-directed RNA polymerase subunit RPC12/RpoP
MPKATGETQDGEPVFEVRSVRLVLRGDAAHFNRLVPCSRCGREVLGPAVLAPGDLDDPVRSLVCQDCSARAMDAPPAGAAPVPTSAVDDGRLAEVERRLEVLTALVAAPDNATPAASAGDLADVDALIADRFDRWAERAARAAEAEVARLQGIDARIDELSVAADADATRRAAVDQELAAVTDRIAKAAAADGARLQGIEDRLAELADEMSGAAEAQHATDDGIAKLAGQLARLQEQSADITVRVGQSLDAARTEVLAVMNEALADARSRAAAPAADIAARIDAMEKRLKRSAAEMSELGELHAALDVGMGALRTEILDVRGAVNRVAGDQGDVADRLEAIIRAPATVEQPTGRKARKGDAGAQASAVLAFTDDVARELQQLKSHVADLQQASEAATATAARASAQASASSPFRGDVRRLQEQVAAQEEALQSLQRTVERLRRKPAAAAPAAKSAKTTKAPPKH